MLRAVEQLILKSQELPFDHPRSCYRLRPTESKQFVATAAAIDAYRQDVITRCLQVLHQQADLQDGLDYLQVFVDQQQAREDLWFIEDDEGGAITALLPGDY